MSHHSARFLVCKRCRQRRGFFQARQDWRCTTKPGKLYVHLFKWPGAASELHGIKDTVERAYLLADPKHKSLPIKKDGDTLTVTLPEKAPGEYDSVLCLTTRAGGAQR
jgi:alpha-L-fucosidase